MAHSLINCFTGEWIKKRRSLAAWLVILGGLFVPFVSIIIFMYYPKQLLSMHSSINFWGLLFQNAWQLMAFMLLPMGIVLAVSLITQLEFKNNTWKQLHCIPVPYTSIYFSKLAVLLIMLGQLFLIFNTGVYFSAVIPSLLNSHIPFPHYSINFGYFIRENTQYYIMCLPMLGLQYMISFHFKNFLIPVAIGLAMVVGGLIALSWQYNYMIPSAYTALHFLETKSKIQPAHNLLIWSAGYFLFFILLGYWLYISKKEKG